MLVEKRERWREEELVERWRREEVQAESASAAAVEGEEALQLLA